MEQLIQEDGKMTCRKEMELKDGLMDLFMKEIIKRGKKMEKESLNG